MSALAGQRDDLPSNVPLDLHASACDLWIASLGSTPGTPTRGFGWRRSPEDLRTYEHCCGRRGRIWWWRSGPVSGESTRRRSPSWRGEVCDPQLPNQVAAVVPRGARCFVVEDSPHVYDTTLAALRGFADFDGRRLLCSRGRRGDGAWTSPGPGACCRQSRTGFPRPKASASGFGVTSSYRPSFVTRAVFSSAQAEFAPVSV